MAKGAWKRKQGKNIAHWWSDFRPDPFDLNSYCNQASAFYKDLWNEDSLTRRCQLCSTKLAGAARLVKLKKAWDDEKP